MGYFDSPAVIKPPVRVLTPRINQFVRKNTRRLPPLNQQFSIGAGNADTNGRMIFTGMYKFSAHHRSALIRFLLQPSRIFTIVTSLPDIIGILVAGKFAVGKVSIFFTDTCKKLT